MIIKTVRIEKKHHEIGTRIADWYTEKRLVETWWFLFVPIYIRYTIISTNQ